MPKASVLEYAPPAPEPATRAALRRAGWAIAIAAGVVIGGTVGRALTPTYWSAFLLYNVQRSTGSPASRNEDAARGHADLLRSPASLDAVLADARVASHGVPSDEAGRAWLSGVLDIQPIRGTSLLEIHVTARDPNVARDVSAAYATHSLSTSPGTLTSLLAPAGMQPQPHKGDAGMLAGMAFGAFAAVVLMYLQVNARRRRHQVD